MARYDLEITQRDRTAANAALDIAFRGDTSSIDDDMARLFRDHSKALYDALVAAKIELWKLSKRDFILADFKNFAVIQQIDAALEKADGQARTAETIASLEIA